METPDADPKPEPEPKDPDAAPENTPPQPKPDPEPAPAPSQSAADSGMPAPQPPAPSTPVPQASDDDAGTEPATEQGDSGGSLCQGERPIAAVIDKLDLLFMVDNSNTMAQEQEALRAQFPRLMQILTSGRRSDADAHPFTPVTDLHVGVVSSDMGTPGVNYGTGSNCNANGGDDAHLQHQATAPGCAETYPSFLSFTSGSDADRLARDFACIAQLGTGGCGFEQQLEAPLKALWPSVYRDGMGRVVEPNPISFLSVTAEGTRGRADVPPEQGGNAGFLRRDPDALLAVVVITDEEDCSMRNTEFVKPTTQLPLDSPYYRQDVNLRCFYNPEMLFDVRNRYYNGFRKLRPGNEQLVLFAAIAGVPADLVDAAARAQIDPANAASLDAYYDRILLDSRMQEVIDPATNPGMGTGSLTPSCRRTDAQGHVASAFPPRRIVELAKAFGANGTVQSICQDDFGPAIDGVVDMLARRIMEPCAGL